MSAENELAVYRMENGQFWICNRACGDTVIESYGTNFPVAKCSTYEELVTMWRELMDESSDKYVYTEHGGRLPSLEELMGKPPRLLMSGVYVLFTGRECDCVDSRDLAEAQWRVMEFGDIADPERIERVIAEGVTYAQAMNIAHLYRNDQPGECTLTTPVVFRDLSPKYPGEEHDCSRHYWRLDRPASH